MAGPISQDLTATLQAYVGNKAVDNIFKVTSFMMEATKGDRLKTKAGGERLRVPVQYAKNSTVQFIGKAAEIDLVEQDVLSAAEFNWKLAAGAVTLYQYDLLRNRGDAERLDLMAEHADNAIASFREEIVTKTFATSQGVNDILNLQSVFRSTGSIGGIDPATYSWWAAYYDNTVEPLTVDDMRTAFFTAGKGSSGPNTPQTIVTSQALYEKYDSLILPHLRTMQTDIGNVGFLSLRFHNANVIFDELMISDEMWFIDWNSLNLYVQPEFKNGPRVEPFSNLPKGVGIYSKLWWMGQWGVKQRRRLGCLDGRTA